MNRYRVFMSDGSIMEQEAFDSKHLYDVVRFDIRINVCDPENIERCLDSNYKGVLKQWDKCGVCQVKQSDNTWKTIWAIYADVFFGLSILRDPVIIKEITKNIFKRDFYTDADEYFINKYIFADNAPELDWAYSGV